MNRTNYKVKERSPFRKALLMMRGWAAMPSARHVMLNKAARPPCYPEGLPRGRRELGRMLQAGTWPDRPPRHAGKEKLLESPSLWLGWVLAPYSQFQMSLPHAWRHWCDHFSAASVPKTSFITCPRRTTELLYPFYREDHLYFKMLRASPIKISESHQPTHGSSYSTL